MEQQLLEQLYISYYKEIYFFLYAMCKRKEIAEDLVHEVFMKALLSLPKNHPNIRAWLYMVARNLYWNTCQKEKHIIYTENPDVQAATESDEMLDRMIQTERKKMLHHALMQLDPRKREVLTLYYFGGLRQKEIAAIMKLTTENVKVLICRGKRELKQYMEEQDYDLS